MKYRFVPFVVLLFLTTVAGGSCSSPKRSVKKKTIDVPPGWYVSISNTQVSVIKASETKQRYSLGIDRQNDLADSNYYLRIAESVFPNQEKLIKNQTLRSKQWYFERPWWHEKCDEIPVPFAITADTINYYLNRYRSLKSHIKGTTYLEEFRETELKRIELFYTAKVFDEGSVKVAEEYLPKIRVTFSMKWYEYCGRSCAWGFEKQREIVFAGKHKILSITGDGPAKMWKSDEKTPYGPDEWIKF